MSTTNDFAISDITVGRLNALVKNIMFQMNINDPEEAVRRVNSGEWIVSQIDHHSNEIPKSVIDYTIHVNREIKYIYPSGLVLKYPNLESSGPSSFDLDKDVEMWRHPKQIEGAKINGFDILAYLVESNSIESCLSLKDGEAIIEKGLSFFFVAFKGHNVFLWKSVGSKGDGNFRVPYLSSKDGTVKVSWHDLRDVFFSKEYGLRFKK